MISQENITLLLSDDEMQNLIEYFDQFDINQGKFATRYVLGFIIFCSWFCYLLQLVDYDHGRYTDRKSRVHQN